MVNWFFFFINFNRLDTVTICMCRDVDIYEDLRLKTRQQVGTPDLLPPMYPSKCS
jgi:hypothetical protein